MWAAIFINDSADQLTYITYTYIFIASITTRNNANEGEKEMLCLFGLYWIAKLINTHFDFDFHFDFDSYEM